MTKTKLIKNWHTVRTLDSARKFNEVVRKKNHKLNKKLWNVDDKIKDLESKITDLKNKRYNIEHEEKEKIPFEFTLSSKEVELDYSKIDKIAKLGWATIYRINGKWNQIRGTSKTGGFDDVKWSLKELTESELFWKLG